MPSVPAETSTEAPRPVLFTRELLRFSVVCAIAALVPVFALPGDREWLRPVLWLGSVLVYRLLEQSVFRPSPVVGERVGEWLFPLTYLGVIGSFLLPPLEFALWPRPLSWQVVTAGFVLVIFGTWLRYRAIDALGEHLSTHVEIRPGHKLVDHGPFRYVRNPGSTGALLFMLGAALILHAYLSIIYIVGFLGIVLFIRMNVEERHSAEKLPGYREYMTRTKRVIPFLY
jgi:protein-S-isoprenylcysteine O-methyltransferase Ste14